MKQKSSLKRDDTAQRVLRNPIVKRRRDLAKRLGIHKENVKQLQDFFFPAPKHNFAYQVKATPPVFVNYYDEKGDMREMGPLYLPAVPRLGEVIDGEWLDGENHEVVRVFHSVPTVGQGVDYCQEPHIYLFLRRLDFENDRPRDEDLRDDVRNGLRKIEFIARGVETLLEKAGLPVNGSDRQGRRQTIKQK